MALDNYTNIVANSQDFGDALRNGGSYFQDVSGNVPQGLIWNSLNNIYGNTSTSPEHQQWLNEYNSNPFVKDQQKLQDLFNNYNSRNIDDYGLVSTHGETPHPYDFSGNFGHFTKDLSNPFAGKSYYDSLKYLQDHLATVDRENPKYSDAYAKRDHIFTDIPGLRGFSQYGKHYLDSYLKNTPIVENGLTGLSQGSLNDLFNSAVWSGTEDTGKDNTFGNYLKGHPNWGLDPMVDSVTDYKNKVNAAINKADKGFRIGGLASLGNIVGGAFGAPGAGSFVVSLANGEGLGTATRKAGKAYITSQLGQGAADIGSSYSDIPSYSSEGTNVDNFNWDNASGVGAGGDFLGGVDTGWGTTPQVPSSYSMGDYQGFNPSSFDSGGNTFSDLYGQLKNSPIVQNYLKPATMWAQQNAPLVKAGLGYLYSNQNAKQNLRRTQQQYDNINSSVAGLRDLYSPNSPYAMQMQKELDARDAASGRRSQYGQRSVELAAKLADQQVRAGQAMSGAYNNMHQLGSYMDQLKNTPRNALASFAQPEVLKNLYDLF